MTRFPPRIGLLGAGGQARELRAQLPPGTAVFHAVEERFLEPGAVDIAQPSEADRRTPVIAAVGAPGLRQRLVSIWPGREFVSVVAASAYVADDVVLGAGSWLAPTSAVSVGVTLGEHCQVNLGTTISHDCRLGDHVTLAPGARLAGRVEVGSGVFVGIGAVVSTRVRLAPGVVVGAGAVVLADIPIENSVVVGAPARVVRRRDRWLDEL